MTKLELVGHIGVDAGLCWIGDPCYILHNGKPLEIGNDWSEFCGKLNEDVTEFSGGLGVCVSTGYRDGEYPVYVTKNAEGRIASVTIKFIWGEIT